MIFDQYKHDENYLGYFKCGYKHGGTLITSAPIKVYHKGKWIDTAPFGRGKAGLYLHNV